MKSQIRNGLLFLILPVLAACSSVPQGPDEKIAQSDPALQSVAVNHDPGSEYAGDTRIFQGIPGLERSRKGRLWVTWYGGGKGEGPDNYVMLVRSDDNGQTWTDLDLVVDPPGPVRAFDPCLWTDPQGTLWLFWAQAYHFWDGRAGVWAIQCKNPNARSPKWTEPVRIANGIMMNKPTVLSSGEWLLPVAVWDLEPKSPNKSQNCNLPEENGSNVFCSTDKGKTWRMLGQTQVPERACDEHMLVERNDGALWMLVRTRYGIGESISIDRGVTWSPGEPSEIPHIPAARFFIRKLNSGKLLLVKHNPPGKKVRSHLTAYLSDDEGKTWYGGLILDERSGVSYPDGVEDKNGVIYISYDYSRYDKKQIFMATFAEEDVAKGAVSSEHARLRVLVNQATGTPP